MISARDLGDAALVPAVDIGVEQRDGERLDALARRVRQVAAQRRLVERNEHRAVGRDALGGLDRQSRAAPAAAACCR